MTIRVRLAPSRGRTRTWGRAAISAAMAEVWAASDAQLTAVTAMAAPAADGPEIAVVTMPAMMGGVALVTSTGPVPHEPVSPIARPMTRAAATTRRASPRVSRAP